MFPSLFVVSLGLCCCIKESSQVTLERPVLSGPSEALVKSVVVFNCTLDTYPGNDTVLFQLYKEDNRDKLLGEYTSMDQEAGVITILVKTFHDGKLECVAKVQNDSNIEPTVSNTHSLKVIEPVESAMIDVRSGPVNFFEGKTLKLRCNVTAGTHVSYKWLLNGRPISRSPLHHFVDDSLWIYRTTSKDSGSYKCVATNNFNNAQFFTANSSEVLITVKDVVSAPDISFTVLKEDSQYSAIVACQSTKGSLPITFSIYNRTELVADMTVEETNAEFKIPVVLNRHLGWLQCQANNGDQTQSSRWIPLEVVSVGGPVKMHYDYDSGENYAVTGLKFYCKAAKGSFPRYQWFLNTTLLHGKGRFYHVVDQPPEQSVLLLSVGRSSTGTYHCEVSDSFDNTTAISSKRRYLDKDVLNRLPTLVVAVVFGCFAALILLVSFCCLAGVMFRRRVYGDKSLSVEMKKMVAAYEGELDLLEYSEDADVVMAAREGEFDQASEASADEWPQIEREKRTLEDKPV